MDTLELSQIEEIANNLITKCLAYQQEKNIIESKIIDLQAKIDQAENNSKKLSMIGLILSNASSSVRNLAKIKIEEIVTNALQFITQDPTIKFIIEESKTRSKPSYEFYIETLVNGNVCHQKPEDACGGGFVDIISVTLKYAYLEIYNTPAIKNESFILDEPGKMVSEQMSIKFAEYLKFLGNQFNKQTIMITHNENLANVADKIYLVAKDKNGISHVSDYSTEAINQNVNESLMKLEEELNAQE